MLNELINRSYPDFSEAEYQEHADIWIATEKTSDAEAYYRQEVLPRSAYRLRSHAPEQPYSLLFVPVGTQPYAPIMACLGNPAETTVLLHTTKSAEFAVQVEEAFATEPWRNFRLVLINELDPSDILRRVSSTYDVVGQPAGSEVICDITGGTKLMTATLAGIAAMNGWRQTYVHSIFVPHHKGSYKEEIISVPSVFDKLGGWNRSLAWELAELGHFGEASRSLALAAEESVASGDDERHLRRFDLAHAYRNAQWPKLSRSLKAVCKSFEVALPEETLVVLRSGETQGLFYWAAQCLVAEGRHLAAAGMLAGVGESCSAGQVKTVLKTIKRQRKDEWHLDQWKPVDDFLGEAYRREVASFGQG